MKAKIRNPSRAVTDCEVIDNADGTYSVEYTPFENGKAQNLDGTHQTIDLCFHPHCVFFHGFFRRSQR